MSHPWFNPLYRRVLTLAFCVGWLIFELFVGVSVWLVLVGTACAFAVWDFFLSGNYPMDAGDQSSS